jgi:FtsZ-binding cell division protein ZapB
MNTEQIMVLVEKVRGARVCEWDVSEAVETHKALQSAVEALVQERDALKVNLHQVSLSHSHLHAENKVLRDALDDLLTANSYYFPVGNPWGDRARAALTRSKS